MLNISLMKYYIAIFLLLICFNISTAQDKAAASQERASTPQDRTLPAESSVITNSQVTIKGKVVPYKVTAGTQPVWDKDGKVIASLYYTYYERSDVSDLNIDDEGYPVQPYGIRDNPHSILDVADIIYIDPVNTGFSRILDPKAERSVFFGVNADVAYLAEWLNTFVSRSNRWTSPKYLIGESYGTTRVSGLALELQNAHWMYLNGVILVSPTNLGIKRDGPVNDALSLPYFAAAAWYQKALPADLQAKDLNEVLPEVEAFTIDELIPALSKGGFIDEQKRKTIAAKMSRYSGLSEKSILQHNLIVPNDFFWKGLLREKGFTIGRLDSRYLGIDKMQAGQQPDYNSELTSWLHAFTPAINYYLRDVLKYKTDIKYNMFGPVHPWDNKDDRTGENLRQAMAENPYMNLMVQSGLYDGATTYFEAKYTLWQIDPSGKLKDRMRFEGYRSGHMMYLRAEDLATSNEHIRDFIKKSMPVTGKPAKY